MKGLRIVFLLVCFSTILLNAQSDLISGTIVTLQGETLTVKIKPAKEDKLAKGISVYNDTTEEYIKYSTKDLSYFKYGDTEYFSKKNTEGKLVFMERIISGPAQLYTYTYKVEKGSNMVEVVEYYVEKPAEDKFLVVTKKDFKANMPSFFADDQQLADKIREGYYTYEEKDAAVEEYNDWVTQGKPGKKWTKEDGNYTKTKDADLDSETPKPRSAVREAGYYDGSKFALDIPILANYSIISSDNLVSAAGISNTSNGFGYSTGLGLRWQLSKTIFWRNGFSARMKRFHSTYQATDTASNVYNVDEYGNLHYFGLYSTLHIEFSNFIIGAGLEFGFGNVYRANYSIKNNLGQVVNGDENQSTSLIAQQNGFNVQADLNLLLGYKIRLANGALNLKPIFQYTIPLASMFDVPINTSGVPAQFSRTGVYGFLINLGFIVDIGFPPKPKVRSLLD